MARPPTIQTLEPGLRRILAPNPSPMTEAGTNTYLIGTRDLVLIDPGPDDPAHLAAIQGAIGADQSLTAILVTHSHLDHTALVPALVEATRAPVLAAGESDWGRSALMQELAAEGALGGGEGRDARFRPDRQIAQGDVIEGSDWCIEVLETPGHMANHLSFVWNGALFSGDLVMGWSTSLVSPPDGDMGAFLRSLARLEGRGDRVFYPGHGEPVTDPAARLRELTLHRRAREAAILAALRQAPASPAALARQIYDDLAAALLPYAERNVLAHLIDLVEKGAVDVARPLRADSVFTARPAP
ncbi:MAG: MBL fold metallo-hydrolase [Pseudomonadota bacterium]